MIDRAYGTEYEVLIVDAGDNWKTRDIIKSYKSYKLRHFNTERGRSKQMNFGAKNAYGDILFFLHSDSIVPYCWDRLILDSQFDCGCFYKEFSSSSIILKMTSAVNNFQTKLFGKMLGDNGIFIKKYLFDHINGYKDIELMEDVELSKSVKSLKHKYINEKIITSSRRFEKNGTIRTLLLMQFIKILYLLRVKPKILEKIYNS